MDILEKKLNYLKKIYDISIEMQTKSDKDDFEGISILLNDRWSFINKVYELERDMELFCDERLASGDDIQKKFLAEIKITLKNIKDADNQLKEGVEKVKDKVGNEIATLVNGKRGVKHYRRSGNVQHNLDVVQ